MEGPAGSFARRRDGGAQVEHGRARQPLPPVGHRRVRLGACRELPLPARVFGVREQFGQLDRAAVQMGGVPGGQLGAQQVQRPAVGDDVVQDEAQQVLVVVGARSRVTRNSGPRARSKAALVRSASSRVAPRGVGAGRRSRPKQEQGVPRGRPDGRPGRGSGCAGPRAGRRSRRTRERRAGSWSAPVRRSTSGMLYEASSGSNWCRNQRRSCAGAQGEAGAFPAWHHRRFEGVVRARRGPTCRTDHVRCSPVCRTSATASPRTAGSTDACADGSSESSAGGRSSPFRPPPRSRPRATVTLGGEPRSSQWSGPKEMAGTDHTGRDISEERCANASPAG